ncbi:MAG: hypothetical protein H3C38_16870 [Rhodospirillales bacterium]|nr:hypothetical protein [Rhodospirillales bacterium]
MQKFEREALLFLLLHLAYGTVGGFLFGALVLWLDLAGLRTLAFNSGEPWLVLGMLFFGLFVTFGSVGMAVGIMSLGRDEN